MRKLVYTAVTATCLVGLSVPPAHAATKVTVHGHDFAGKHLIYNSGDCATWRNDPIHAAAPATVYAEYKKPGLIGQRAIGWQFGSDGGVTGSEAGALAYVASPATLSDLRFSAFLGDASEANEGQLIAYVSSTGSFTSDYYAGFANLDANFSRSWNTWTNQDSRTLTWLHWLGDHWESAPDSTIPSLAQSLGSTATAYVGPELGCTGRTWYVDNLRVTTSAGTRAYDFEGLRTGSIFGGWHKLSDPDNDVVWGLKHFVRNYSETEWVVGYSGYVNDLVRGSHGVGDFVYFRDQGSLYARHWGSRKWHKADTDTFTVKGVAAFKLRHLKKHTDYYFRYAGSRALEPSRSQVMSVDVRALLSGHLVNKTVYRGARLTVTGQRLPKDKGVKVFLQRHVNHRWHTIARTRTRLHGTFRVSARARSLGTWSLRLKMAKGKGNLGNRTKSFSVTIKKRPAPPPTPVISTPPPCTSCGGNLPDVPIGGKAASGHRPVTHRGATPGRGGSSPAPGQLPLREPGTWWARRSVEGP